MSQTSDSWSSRIGFILAAAGSAIGLGAIWRFPYTAGTNGGAVFFLMFIALTLLVGLPMLVAEFFMGRHTRRNAIATYDTLAPGSGWRWAGVLGVVTCFVILSFYSVVGGWVLAYLYHTLAGHLGAGTDYAALFGQIIANPWQMVGFQALTMLLTVAVIQSGVSTGIERANKFMMPALFVLFILLAVRSLTLPGAWAGVEFLLKPDWGYLNGKTLLLAMGQAFFALSLGMTIMVTYASYLGKTDNLYGAASHVVWMNLLISLLAGLVIFPAVFALGFEPGAGPGLIFVVLPAVFQQLPFGMPMFVVFLVLVLFATLTSTFSLLETITAAASRGNPYLRRRMTWILGVVITLVGVPSALSFGVLSDVKLAGKTVFDILDFVTSTIAIPLGVLLVALFVGWRLDRDTVLQSAAQGSGLARGLLLVWFWLVRWLAPIAICIVFLNSLGVF
ncbi:MAG: sodium-dependent transporter [Pseudomonadota bacterium]|nr:sodium-dependent transporter [Pseudomonadota bacterium]